jgi:hypothetical protein
MSDELDDLLDDEEVSDEELVAALRLIRKRRGSKLARSARDAPLARPEDIPFPSAANAALAPRGQPQSFNDDRARWEERERRTQGGVYSPGGSTAGGIFGEGAIPLDDYDAPSEMRGAPVVSAAANERLVALLERQEARDVEREAQLRAFQERERERQLAAETPETPKRRTRRLGWSSKR